MQKESKATDQPPADTSLIISIAQDVVEQVAPEELPYFSALSTFYSRKPGSVLKQQMAKDDELGFGVGEVAPVLAPIILLIVQQVVVQVSSDATEKGAGTLFRRLWKKTFERSSPRKQEKQSVSLEYTLTDIRSYTYETAREFEVPEAKANQIADIVAGRLATRQNTKEKR